MRKPLITAFLCCTLFIFQGSAQNLPKTLLWRISGNGLEKSSFLYGTMHIYDPRLMDLGDSLLYAISSSEGFANELDLNEMTPMVVGFIKQEIEKSLSLKDMLDKKTFDKYGPRLSKKLNKPADKITSLDILKEKNKWIDEGYKGKKMQTFLDAYLADLAYRQGKWLGGIEDFSDQSGLLNTLIDESDIKQLALGDGENEQATMNNMVTIYQNGDLDGFQKMLNSMDSSMRDVLLIKRNRKMAFRMDSLARVRSIVFAVGAAHLPGDEGLISLLRKKGFTVSPVYSSKKVSPKDYYLPEVEKPWVEVSDPEGHYKVLMPGKPGDLKLYGIMSLEVYFNIFNSTWYMTASAGLPYDSKGVDSISGEMLKQLFGSKTYKQEKSLDINGIPGKSYVLKNSDGYRKVYLLYKDNLMYYAVGFSASDTVTSIKAVDKFFDSFQAIPVKKEQNASAYLFTDSVTAYRISLPGKPKPVDNLPQSGNNSTKARLMITSDPETGAYYLFGCTETEKGYSFQNDNETLRLIRENMMSKIQDKTRDTIYTQNGKQVLEMDGSMLNGSMMAKAKVIVRGNRYYTVMAMYGPGKWNKTAGEVLGSLQLMEYTKNKWESQNSPDSLFSSWAPDRLSFIPAGIRGQSKSAQYESFDSSRGNSYNVKLDSLNPYVWAKNDSALWKMQKEEYVSLLDTVISERIFEKDGLYQYEIFKKPKEANNILRMQMILRGDIMYRLVTVQEPATIREENVNRFFDYLHFNSPPPETHVFESKAAVLLKDLLLADSATREMTITALKDAPFTTAELPLLQQAVLVSYPRDSNYFLSVNQVIADRIIALNDSTSAGFALSHFSPESGNEVKEALLEIISAWHNTANYERLGKLLLSSRMKSSLSYRVTEKWNDSLRVTSAFFPTVLPLLKDSVLAPDIMDIARHLLDSNLISLSVFNPWQETILGYAESRYKIIKADSTNFDGSDYSVIDFLKRFKNGPSNAMLKKWLLVKGNTYLKQRIVLALLENGQSISPQALLDLAGSRYSRIELYENLKKYKKLALFPAKYLTQQNFAESLTEDAASEFSDDADEISLIKVKDIKWKGKTRRFFFYDVFMEEDNEHWLAVAGPFSLNRTDISYTGASSKLFSDEQYDDTKQAAQMKTLMDQLEKESAESK